MQKKLCTMANIFIIFPNCSIFLIIHLSVKFTTLGEINEFNT
jgi:hypothetical protein